MPSITSLVAVVAFAGLAITAPTPPKHKFTVPRKAVDYGFLPYGQHQTMKTYQKFNAKAPSHVSAAAAAVTGKVVANPSDAYDSSYLCSVTAGTSVVNLDFDTGSSDL